MKVSTNLKSGEVVVYRTYIDAVKGTGMGGATIWRGLKNKISKPQKYTFEYVQS